jgi:hypothetical protein
MVRGRGWGDKCGVRIDAQDLNSSPVTDNLSMARQVMDDLSTAR